MTIALVRQRLDHALFRDPPAREPGGYRNALTLGGFLVLAVLLQLLRVGWSPSLHSLWAEDGAVYFSGAVHSDFGRTLFDTYATYLVVVPRGIAELADLVPLQDAPAAIAILSAITVAVSGALVWHATAGLLASPWLRATLVGALVLSPVGGLESTASAAYVPWYMLFATFWILLWRPRTRWAAAGAGLFALLTGLSTPGVWFFLPLALLRSLVIRDGRDGLVLAGYWVGAVAQVPVLAFNDEPAVSPLWTHDIWTDYLQRVLNGAAFGSHLGGEAWARLGWPFIVVLLLLSLAAVVFGLARSDLGGRLFAAVSIPISLAMFVVSVYQRAVGSEMLWPTGQHMDGAGRYAIVPAMLLISAAAILLDNRAPRRDPQPRLRWLQWAFAGLVMVAVVASFNVENVEVRGAPPWQAAIDQGAKVCVQEGSEETPLPTSPPGWGVNVPCSQLDEFAEPARR